MDKTISFSLDDVNSELVLQTLKQVKEILEEKGYNSTNQIVGYLISGDPGYITSYKDARKKITKFSREEILMAIINGYLGR